MFSVLNDRVVYDNGEVRIWRCPACKWWRDWEVERCPVCRGLRDAVSQAPLPEVLPETRGRKRAPALPGA